jgi:hypothetical protein
VIIKKSKDVAIKKNIGAMFRRENLVEYKSPEHYFSIGEFYKTYGYACLYAYLNKVSITETTISFVENHYPRDLIAHLKEIRGYQVEERCPGIYTVIGDIIPIQIIDSRKLSTDENLWLKNLSDTLDIPEIQEIIGKIQQRSQDAQILVYLNAVYKANFENMEEAFKMTEAAPTFQEFLERMGYNTEWEAKGEAKSKLEIAKNLLAKGLPVEEVTEITRLSPEAVRELVI